MSGEGTGKTVVSASKDASPTRFGLATHEGLAKGVSTLSSGMSSNPQANQGGPPSQIKSRERVAEHGEVLTGAREVNAMLDLVKNETERIDSRFLEPACGTGNFLVAVLQRKLAIVDARYKRSQVEWERNAIIAVGSVYGIDIQQDNVQDCRERLYATFLEAYERHFRRRVRKECRNAVKYILSRNIIWGNALTLTEGHGESGAPIIFSEWSPVNGSMIKRRDFAFRELLRVEERGADPSFGKLQKSLYGDDQETLFEEPKGALKSDTGEGVFIPEPVGEYPVQHFLEIGHEVP